MTEWLPPEAGQHLVARADAALYEAKRAGRARVHSAHHLNPVAAG